MSRLPILLVALAAQVPLTSPALRLALEISAAVAEPRAGDEILVTFTITNIGTTTYQYSYRNYDRSGRMPEYALEAFDARGQRIPDPRTLAPPRGYIGGGLGSLDELEPGAQFTQTVPLNLWALATAPGEYTIRGRYSLGRGLAVESQLLELRVLPRSQAELGRYIDALAAELAQARDPALRVRLIQRLMYTADRRAVPVLRNVTADDNNVKFWIGEAFAYYLR